MSGALYDSTNPLRVLYELLSYMEAAVGQLVTIVVMECCMVSGRHGGRCLVVLGRSVPPEPTDPHYTPARPNAPPCLLPAIFLLSPALHAKPRADLLRVRIERLLWP